MKKIIKIIFVTLSAVVLILITGGIIFLKTFDLNRFKPQIIAVGQSALGRAIDFARADLKLSFRKGIQLCIADILVGEHPDFGRDSFLTAKETNLTVSIRDLILKRQIRVLGVTCNSPKLNIIRLKDNRINAQSFGAIGQDKQQAGATSAQARSAKSGQAAPIGLPVLFINRIDINNGRLAYMDYSFDPKLSLTFDRITLRIDDFSLARPFPIVFRAAFASNSQNIFAQGNGQLNLDRLSFSLKDVKAALELSALSMEMLRNFIPQLKDAPLPEIKSGALSVSIDSFEAGQPGLIDLKGRGALSRGSLRIKELAALEPIEASFTISESVFALTKASFGLGKGRIELLGDLSDYLFKQDYSLKVMLRNIDLNECIDQSTYPIKIKGLVFGDMELKGQGFDPKTALSKLSGNGTIEIKKGQLTDINILKMVLDKLSFAPDLAAALEAGLPDRFKENLRRKDTVITGFKTAVSISNSSVIIQSMNMEAETFRFQGSGAAGFDQAYSFEGSFIIPQELSFRMTAAVPQMEYLLDEEKQIRFPLKISGRGASVSFMPDVKQIGIGVIKQKGRQELEKVLDKILGIERIEQDSSQGDGQDSEEASSTTDKKDGKRQLIDSIIGTILKE